MMHRTGYLIGVCALVVFALLSAGRDAVAKTFFNGQVTEPVFATFVMSAVSLALFYLIASIRERHLYTYSDFFRAPGKIKEIVYWANFMTLVAFLTALAAVDRTNAYVGGVIDYGGSPLITALFAMIYLKDRPSLGGVIGIVVSFVGVVLLIGAVAGGNDSSISSKAGIFGVVYALSSAIAFAINQIYNKKLVDFGITKEKVWLMRLPAIVVILGCWSVTRGLPNSQVLPQLILWSAFGTTLPLFLLAFAFEYMKVVNVSLFLFLVPVFAFIFSLVLGHFSHGAPMELYVFSGSLVLIGVVISERSNFDPDAVGT